MSEELLYTVKISVKRGASIDNIEILLEQLLKELYEDESVESITVRDRTPPMDEDMDEILDVLKDIDSEHIKNAMDTVRELEGCDSDE